MVNFLAQHPVLSFFFLGNRQVIQNWEDPEKVLDQALDEMQVESWIMVDPQTLGDLRYPWVGMSWKIVKLGKLRKSEIERPTSLMTQEMRYPIANSLHGKLQMNIDFLSTRIISY